MVVAYRFVFQAGGKVQEKPTAARVEVEDPDCQRKSEGDEGRKYREGETNRNAAAAFMPNGAEIAGEETGACSSLTPSNEGTQD